MSSATVAESMLMTSHRIASQFAGQVEGGKRPGCGWDGAGCSDEALFVQGQPITQPQAPPAKLALPASSTSRGLDLHLIPHCDCDLGSPGISSTSAHTTPSGDNSVFLPRSLRLVASRKSQVASRKSKKPSLSFPPLSLSKNFPLAPKKKVLPPRDPATGLFLRKDTSVAAAGPTAAVPTPPNTPPQTPRKLLDDDQFSTPPSTPRFLFPEPVVARPPSSLMASQFTAEPFTGEDPDVNPQDFLRAFRRAVLADEARVAQFPDFLAAQSDADLWYTDLDADTKATWSKTELAFNERWPKKMVVAKSRAKYEEELLATKLKESEMGSTVTVGKREVAAHVAWADKVEVLAKGAGVYNLSILLSTVVKQLPLALRAATSGEQSTWKEFLVAVRKVESDALVDGSAVGRKVDELERRLMTRIAGLSAPPSPTAGIRKSMATASISTPAPVSAVAQPASVNPLLTAGGGRGNLFSTQPVTPSRPSRGPRTPATPSTPASRAALLRRTTELPHHPPTEEGRKLHALQQLAWVEKHGANAWVDETTPYPLRPGTMPVNSGECYRCGMMGHRGANCPVPQKDQLQAPEQKWRVLCSNGLREPVDIRYVTISDYGHTIQVLGESDEEGEGQGNGEGSSA
ncbi:hypothetical protein DFP72DRAFT_1069071 [Ephemerocybe angulata]|uniref:CCHC-type domain-containing protein n=1 Tax=Ephemerocybe angulata TaxID=980116 RepID=A0A8H6HWY3_9AGAR|nr:hypothetical protein DFP72DRAFT_1069071 [Tulosesus angulatus]